MERELLRQRQEKESDQMKIQVEKESNKIKIQHKIEQDRRAKDNDEAYRKLRKQRLNHNEHQFKAFLNAQKKEYKHNKESAKMVKNYIILYILRGIYNFQL